MFHEIHRQVTDRIHKALAVILSFPRHHQVVASGVINGLPRLNR
jgi:hypothetical protein